jgi:hypothetical protein
LHRLSVRAYDDLEVIRMSNKVLLGACLLLALAGCATTPSTPPTAKASAAATAPPGCVGTTATRLPVNPGSCAGPGHTLTQDQLVTTGATDTAGALRLVDPTMTISGR